MDAMLVNGEIDMAKQARTIEEVIKRLNALDGADKESDHLEADSLLLDALLIAGRSDVVTAFQDARTAWGFWYA